MELVEFKSLHCSTQQKLENERNKSADDRQNICKRRKIEDPAPALEFEVLQEPEIEQEQDCDHPIFHIYLTMDMILKTLNRSDLLRCRGISSNFNFFATYVLLTSPLPVSLDFEYNWELQQYICSKPEPESALQNNLGITDSSNTNTLMNLSKLLETSTDFPCKKYTFRNGIIRSKDIQTFLELHGSEVRALSLQIYCPVSLAHENELDEGELRGNERSLDLLRKLLLEQIPNVKSLSLSEFPRMWKILKQKMYSEEMGKEIQSLKNSENYPYLKNLKTLKLGEHFGDAKASSKIISEILETAINLENVYSAPSKILRQQDKFHLLQSLPLYASCDTMERYEHIATYRRSRLRSITLMLSELTTKDYTLIQERFGKALYKILEACSSTLEHIKFKSPCGYLCGPNIGFKIPLLPKVKYILVAMNDVHRLSRTECPKEIQTQLTSRFFPPGFQFKTTFPHLTEVAFFFDHCAAWEDHFDNYEPSLTVKSLIFMNSEILPSSCMLYCSKIFPNTAFLEIRPKYFSFYDASQSGLFNFERLKELRCDLVLNTGSNNLLTHGNVFPFLDAAFTGYSPAVVQYLHHKFLNGQRQAQLEILQTLHESPRSRSILNLKDLKMLKITVVDRSIEIDASYPPIFTHVSSFFAFRSHPHLQLQLEFRVLKEENLYKVVQKMEPIRPFVEFEDTERHNKNCFNYYYDEGSIMKI